VESLNGQQRAWDPFLYNWRGNLNNSVLKDMLKTFTEGGNLLAEVEELSDLEIMQAFKNIVYIVSFSSLSLINTENQRHLRVDSPPKRPAALYKTDSECLGSKTLRVCEDFLRGCVLD
jgi:hypothetical protein